MQTSSQHLAAASPQKGRTAETSEPRILASGPQPNPASVIPSIRLIRQVSALASRAESKPELMRGLSAVLKAEGPNALWLVTRDTSDQWSSPISLLGDDKEIMALIGPAIEQAITLAQNNQTMVVMEPGRVKGFIILAAPVFSGELVSDVLVALTRTTHPSAHAIDWAINLAADSITRWQTNRFINSTQDQLASLSSFVNMAAAMNRSENQLETAITLVNELKAATNAAHVTLLLRQGRKGPFRLTAMSGVEFFDRNAATTQTIESTVLGIEEKPVFWYRPAADSESGNKELHINLQNFCTLFDTAGCAVLPLRDAEQHLFGWLLITISERPTQPEATEKHFRQISALVSGQLQTVLNSQRTMTRVCLDNARQTIKQRLFQKIAVMAGLVAITLCIPFPYKVPCDCELQLTSRRFVAAPYEGLLEKTLVDNGDVVEQGQSLALMDARQLRMELSGLEADLQSERKKRDSALARGNIAESQIARSEMSRLESRIAIISGRLENTEIRSPISGVIVSGDLDKAEGAPLEMGQNLFEVGPLENMLVEIHIPEREIKHVEPGMDVRFEFDAFPFETFAGKIERIHPRAEVIESDSVFVAEINLTNESGQLRPGLKGRARIIGQRHPLGWNLFHSAIENGRHWLIW